MKTDWKALCAELAQVLAEEYGVQREFDSGDPLLGSGAIELISRVRTHLSQPEPQGLTDEEILNLSEEHCVSYTRLDGSVTYPYENDMNMKDDVLSFARALIAVDRARWGRPAVEPVLVSERLPGPEDCWPDGHEKVGCCWLWTPVDGLGRWEVQHRDWASEPGESYTHWLPCYALPVRTPTETNGQT